MRNHTSTARDKYLLRRHRVQNGLIKLLDYRFRSRFTERGKIPEVVYQEAARENEDAFLPM